MRGVSLSVYVRAFGWLPRESSPTVPQLALAV